MIPWDALVIAGKQITLEPTANLKNLVKILVSSVLTMGVYNQIVLAHVKKASAERAAS